MLLGRARVTDVFNVALDRAFRGAQPHVMAENVHPF